jgi:hypothetical protein
MWSGFGRRIIWYMVMNVLEEHSLHRSLRDGGGMT